MTSPDQPHFYLSRQGKAHGPLSWSEICSYLAYGSVAPGELLSPDGRKDWRSLDEWREVIEGPPPSSDDQGFFHKTGAFAAALWHALKPADKTGRIRRRVVRFREWEHVPENQRSSHVIASLFYGFFFFPPRLWSACTRVFSQHIYRRTSDEAGFLKTWPPAAESICAVLILVNALWWIGLLVAFQAYASPFLSKLVQILKEGPTG